MLGMIGMAAAIFTDGYKGYAFILTVITGVSFTRKFIRNWPYRHIKKIFGIRNGDRVVLLCSELPDAESRQWVEPREFIHLMKYGDVDALLELVASLLRIYPDIDLKILTANDVDHVQVDLDKHVILVGGPDYNPLIRRLITDGKTAISYYSEDIGLPSPTDPSQITLFEKVCSREHARNSRDEDVGYFERFKNPYSTKHNVIIFGGCHTIGVSAASKVFSAYSGGRNDLPAQVVENARVVAKATKYANAFYIIFDAKKVGVNVAIPEIREDEIKIVSSKTGAERPFWHRTPANATP